MLAVVWSWDGDSVECRVYPQWSRWLWWWAETPAESPESNKCDSRALIITTTGPLKLCSLCSECFAHSTEAWDNFRTIHCFIVTTEAGIWSGIKLPSGDTGHGPSCPRPRVITGLSGRKLFFGKKFITNQADSTNDFSKADQLPFPITISFEIWLLLNYGLLWYTVTFTWSLLLQGWLHHAPWYIYP